MMSGEDYLCAIAKDLEALRSETEASDDDGPLLDWLADGVLEILRIADKDGEVVGHVLVLGTGGPHVELNTRDLTLYCWHGKEFARLCVEADICDMIDDALIY